MKIAIISDTHNNLAAIKKIINWLNEEKIGLLLHCGDISAQETVNEIKNNFKGEARFVKGNADFDLDLPDKEEIETDGKKIAFCHKPELAKELAKTGKYNLVFYGHTHRPWQDKIILSDGKSCNLVNPGEVAGQFTKPAFTLYDTANDKLELKIIERELLLKF